MGLAIEARNLVKKYVSYERRGFLRRRKLIVEALRGVSFSVKKGEVFGLLGPNGAGKTTTIKIIATLLIPDGGYAKVLGHDVVEEAEKVREVIGVALSVEKGFFWALTGRENLKYFGMLRGLKDHELEQRMEYVIRLVGLDELNAADKPYEEYSLGMRARLSLARALLPNPPILLLDEPTVGLDPPSARTIRNLLVDLAHKENKTVMVTTHNMFEAEMICDRVAIINEGKIIAIGRVPDLKRMVSNRVAIELIFSTPSTSLNTIEEKVSRYLSISEINVEPLKEGKAKIRIIGKPGEEEIIASKVIEILYSMNVKVHHVHVQEPTLEDVFILMTKKGGEKWVRVFG
ncbi:MAG: ABC transporter ATP-binding protein [Thermoprotei archaeon]|nr:MAG: ABC transporter ATP-binding protein [Thermoprotei archaeon]